MSVRQAACENLLSLTEQILRAEHRISLADARPEQLHMALGQALMLAIAPDWQKTEEDRAGKRQASYLSAEYLIGRQVYNNLYCAGALEKVDELLAAKGACLADLEDIEDAALGNGGLGRLAACYLDSAATCDIPLTGYGLRYKFGLFRQRFKDNRQCEQPDDWTRQGDPWSVRRDELSVIVPFKGFSVRAVPYDMPVLGYRTQVVGTLRLWQTESLHEIDFEKFNDQQYARACADKNRCEDIVKLLYPNDTMRAGKLMRIKQQYVLSSASMQDMLRTYRAQFGRDYGNFSSRYAVQLNDTHPVMAIPELIRLLMEDGVRFDDAFDIAHLTFSYTNHTVMREALEVWDESLLRAVVPELVPVIRKIDARLKSEQRGLSVVRDGRVHMAELSVYACHKVNGVARIHSEILKSDVFREWHEAYPDRFTNVTNGVTQRRWLGLCNPELTSLLTERLGDGFLRNLDQLSGLKPMIDGELAARFLAVKQQKKRQLADYIERQEGVVLPEHFLFDVQVKRLHEYKRQLMNALCIWAIYRELKSGALTDFQPMACLFGAKAAPGYARAKAIIRLINQMAAVINADDAVSEKLKVVFVADYNCSYAEKIIPAADLSEQISPAGTEASGTGNMKLMLNGALTLGTMDGANVEIVEQAGRENNFIFGATVEELKQIKGDYNPRALYEADARLRGALDALIDGTFEDSDGALAELHGALLDGASWHAPDHYFVLKDFEAYYAARLRANRAYADKVAFAQMALYNIAGAGKFSSDRALADYARDIWRL
ncbi:MAG: glycogen/starch/alpha-glucan phosphorylase [Clostridia bacterium]